MLCYASSFSSLFERYSRLNISVNRHSNLRFSFSLLYSRQRFALAASYPAGYRMAKAPTDLEKAVMPRRDAVIYTAQHASCGSKTAIRCRNIEINWTSQFLESWAVEWATTPACFGVKSYRMSAQFCRTWSTRDEILSYNQSRTEASIRLVVFYSPRWFLSEVAEW
jgi:hypothetical protein